MMQDMMQAKGMMVMMMRMTSVLILALLFTLHRSLRSSLETYL